MKSLTQYLNQDVLRQFLNLFAILAAFGINVWANVAPPSGLSIGEISNTLFREVQITPANYAFAIWGIIYLGLITFGIYQILPAQRHDACLRRVSYLLVVASLAQIAWVFLFQYQRFVLSVVAMLGILLPLIGIYLRLGIGSRRVSRQKKWYVHIPLSIYLAWISVATILNVAIALYDLDWNGWGIDPQSWTVIALFVAAAITATAIAQRQDLAFSLVIVWAFVAIAVRHIDTVLISGTAGGLAIALLLFSFLKNSVNST
ncbi:MULTISPECIES: tryptophan-rich sensory protein [unclassified Coleofasciculus]|uniref:tryptophan-rich sensory protein n=1 Tax=unclassified Coleofasciculus TaxID=2692782 RepID=UPI001880145D|nr:MULTISPECIES: tryptophan-rich sensory protein [unclassified Coleofasciculus]MBE9127159.1 tryptophan-rich sensory protein [Coleofasciculus sp. LEGE 07081]MBE9150480.1 tryptophan-rich sensory protein [Coleofasciculus sp. LEGE 07092]